MRKQVLSRPRQEFKKREMGNSPATLQCRVYINMYTLESRSKAPAYKAMLAYKEFEKNPLINFCSTFYISSKA